MVAIFIGGNFLGVNFLGSIFKGAISRGGNFQRGNFHRWVFSEEAIFIGGNFLGDNFHRAALSQLSFVQFWPHATSLPRLLFKCQKAQRRWTRVWMWRFRSTVESFFFFWIWIIWKIGVIILFKRITAEKFVCCPHTYRFLDCTFSFCIGILQCWWLLKVKKRINKALSKQPIQFLLPFHFLVYKDWVSKLNLRLSSDLQ